MSEGLRKSKSADESRARQEAEDRRLTPEERERLERALRERARKFKERIKPPP